MPPATSIHSGLRRVNNATTAAPIVSSAAIHERSDVSVRINPLAHIDDAALWSLVERHDSIVHPLHRQGYPSIGCAPCTRAIAAGESLRAGRWWWEDPQHSECGLHVRHTAGRGAAGDASSARVG